MSLKKDLHRANERKRRERWVQQNKTNPVVKQWLRINPRPKSFKGSRAEWAYAEMRPRPE